MNYDVFFATVGIVMGVGYFWDIIFYTFSKRRFNFIKWTTVDFIAGVMAGLWMGLQ